MHSEKSAISLSLMVLPFPTVGSLVIVFRSGLSPTHASLRSQPAIMITTSNSSLSRSGTPNQLLGVLLHTITMSGLSRVRTELAPLLIIPSLAHHPVETNRQLAGHGDLGGFPSSPHHQVKILAAPLGHTTHCYLRRFHQQENASSNCLVWLCAPAVAGSHWNLPAAPVPDNSPPACRNQSDRLGQ